MENLDLDIKNYSLSDLERFLKLKNKYTTSDIELRKERIQQQLLNSGHVNKRFKRDLIEFLEKAKELLISNNTNVIDTKPSTVPINYKLDVLDKTVNISTPKEENIIHRPVKEYIYTQPSEYLPGKMNPLNTRIITKCLNIDTRFRSNFYNTESSDITIQIPGKLNKVVSMELASIELPASFYNISERYGNNYMHIYLNYKHCSYPDYEKSCYRKVVIPDGNYTDTDLIDFLNHMVSKPDVPILASTTLYIDENGNIVNSNGKSEDEHGHVYSYKKPSSAIYDVFSFIEFKLDVNQFGSGSRRITVGTKNTNVVDITEIILDFTKDMNGEPDNSFDKLYRKLGWSLGFTKPLYKGSNFYSAESILEPATKYIYLAIDDFNNNSNSTYVSVFGESMMGNDVLARISFKNNRCNLITETQYEISSEARNYFGPVDITRLKIRLLDEYGRTLQMNRTEYSFCLKLNMLYDL